MTSAAVLVEDVHVRFGDVQALAGIDLAVAPGTTLGVLGHNGAGKTTLIRVLTTLLRPDRRTGARRRLRRRRRRRSRAPSRIGVTGQYAGLDDFLTGRENLELIGTLAGLGAAARAPCRRALIDSARPRRHRRTPRRRPCRAGHDDASTSPTSLVGEPVRAVPRRTDHRARSRRPVPAVGRSSAELTADGTTVVLTTQYLDEADRLADDIVVLDHGRIVGPRHARRAEAARRRQGRHGHRSRPPTSTRISRRPDRHEVRATDGVCSRVARTRPPTPTTAAARRRPARCRTASRSTTSTSRRRRSTTSSPTSRCKELRS